MTHTQTGLSALVVFVLLFLLYGLIRNYREFKIYTVIEWAIEIVTTIIITIAMFAATAGIVWLIGFVINSIWSLFR